MKTRREALEAQGLPCVTYLETMLEGGTAVEMQATRERTVDELELLAVASFGDATTLSALTKKFSLWQ